MNTIMGRAGEACVAVGNAVCRDTPLTQNVTAMTMTGANPFTSETRKRIGSPSAKKYNRTGNENRAVYQLPSFRSYKASNIRIVQPQPWPSQASCLAKGK